MRANIYKELIAKLKEYSDAEGDQVFKHFDLWNEQVEFLEDETPFETPAVFVEFRAINWGDTIQKVQRGTVPIRLHIVTEWKGASNDGSIYQEKALERLDLVDGLAEHLYDWNSGNSGINIQRMQRNVSYTNHNHGELVEDIEDFTCTVYHLLKQ